MALWVIRILFVCLCSIGGYAVSQVRPEFIGGSYSGPLGAIIGSGFGDIFFANCFQNGILPIIVDKEIVDGLAAEIEITQGAGRIGIDLEEQTITSPTGKRHHFEIDPRRRTGLLGGLDEVALTLQRDAEIRAFQASDRAQRPWIHFARKQA